MSIIADIDRRWFVTWLRRDLRNDDQDRQEGDPTS